MWKCHTPGLHISKLIRMANGNIPHYCLHGAYWCVALHTLFVKHCIWHFSHCESTEVRDGQIFRVVIIACLVFPAKTNNFQRSLKWQGMSCTYDHANKHCRMWTNNWDFAIKFCLLIVTLKFFNSQGQDYFLQKTKARSASEVNVLLLLFSCSFAFSVFDLFLLYTLTTCITQHRYRLKKNIRKMHEVPWTFTLDAHKGASQWPVCFCCLWVLLRSHWEVRMLTINYKHIVTS